MEVLLSAVASDLVGRLVSFLISKFHEPGSTDDDVVVRLQRSLLRARVVVEEAEARQVTNRAMLLQLNHLRGQMCRGAYVLDAFMRRAVDCRRRRGSHATGSQSPGLPAPGSDGTGGLSSAVESMEAALSDMKEFVVLLGAYPRVVRQPYSAYLYMEMCMFGRQMEKEQTISFLLQPAQDLDVLPIIGRHEVGKRTLVEHVCLDERVRQQFAKIHRICSDDLGVRSQEPLQGLIDTAQRSLIVIDLAGGGADEEERWRRFRSSLRRRAHRESKVIITSRTEKHSGLGTVPALRLRAPRREELWYLFKALAFGGADPEERPELLRIAMAVFRSIPDIMPFAAANIIAASLRADLSATSWRRTQKVFAGVTELQTGVFSGGSDRGEKTTGYYYPCIPAKDAPYGTSCLLYDSRKLPLTAPRSELPKVTALELLAGGAFAPADGGERRFELLLWQSRIPPYGSYVATCECDMARAPLAVTVVKRPNKRARDQHQDDRP